MGQFWRICDDCLLPMWLQRFPSDFSALHHLWNAIPMCTVMSPSISTMWYFHSPHNEINSLKSRVGNWMQTMLCSWCTVPFKASMTHLELDAFWVIFITWICPKGAMVLLLVGGADPVGILQARSTVLDMRNHWPAGVAGMLGDWKYIFGTVVRPLIR